MREVVKKRFGQNLRRVRRDRGLSQEALADLAGIHRTEVSLLERGGRDPEMGTMLKLAATLGVSLDELAAGITWRPPAEGSSGGRFHISPGGDRETRGGPPR